MISALAPEVNEAVEERASRRHPDGREPDGGRARRGRRGGAGQAYAGPARRPASGAGGRPPGAAARAGAGSRRRPGFFRTEHGAGRASTSSSAPRCAASSKPRSRRSSPPSRPPGLPLDHVNAHKHFHLHPTIAGLMLRIGKRHGAKAMRVPLEPTGVLAAVETQSKGRAERDPPWARLLRRRLGKAGITTPDQVFGLAWSGAMTAPRLAGLLAHLPEGLSEIYLHPAKAGGFPGAAPGYRYAEELAALTDPAVITAAGSTGIRRGGFADFLPSSPSPPEGGRGAIKVRGRARRLGRRAPSSPDPAGPAGTAAWRPGCSPATGPGDCPCWPCRDASRGKGCRRRCRW